MVVRCLAGPAPPSPCPGPAPALPLPWPQLPALPSGPCAAPGENPVGGPESSAGQWFAGGNTSFMLLQLSMLCPSPPPGAPGSTAGRKADRAQGAHRWSQGACAPRSVSPRSSVRLPAAPPGTGKGDRFPLQGAHRQPPLTQLPDAPGALHFPGHPGRIQGTHPPRLPGESPERHRGLATLPGLHCILVQVGPWHSGQMPVWLRVQRRNPTPNVKPSHQGCALR